MRGPNSTPNRTRKAKFMCTDWSASDRKANPPGSLISTFFLEHAAKLVGGEKKRLGRPRGLPELQKALGNEWDQARAQNTHFIHTSLVPVHVHSLRGFSWQICPSALPLSRHLEGDPWVKVIARPSLLRQRADGRIVPRIAKPPW